MISNGGQVINLSSASFLRDNIVVTGTGSVWNSGSSIFGGGGSLVISNGGSVVNGDAYAGSGFANSDFMVRVADSAVWQNGALYVGSQGPGNSVTVAGGTVSAASLAVGLDSTTCSNWVQLDDGSLFVTNATGDAVLEVRYGKLILNGGTLRADKLVMTNDCGLFARNGGTLIVGSLVLDPALDADGDGMPNSWEQSYGFNPLDAADANADNDGDGTSNLQEYLAGTDPFDYASVFRITRIAREGDDIRVTWSMGAVRTNTLQATSGPANGGYTNSFTDLFIVTNAVGSVTNYLDLGGATNGPMRFYRVRVSPAWAGVHYVNLNSVNPVPPYTNWATAATTIQDAVDVATNGELVLVNDGTYQTGGRPVNGYSLTNRVAITKRVTVQSVHGPAVTVIRGTSGFGSTAARCVYLTNDARTVRWRGEV